MAHKGIRHRGGKARGETARAEDLICVEAGGVGGVLSGQEMDVAGPSLPSTTRGRMMGLET